MRVDIEQREAKEKRVRESRKAELRASSYRPQQSCPLKICLHEVRDTASSGLTLRIEHVGCVIVQINQPRFGWA